MHNHLKAGGWPGEVYELLLRAAFLEGDAAREAFDRWQAVQDVDEVDGPSQQLLPLLHRNLQTLGMEPARMGTFKGLSRRAWYENQLLWGHTAPILQALENAGISPLLIGGAATALLYCHDSGLRPVKCVEILIPVADLTTATSFLTGAKWMPTDRPIEKFNRQIASEVYRTAFASQAFRAEDGVLLKLHWHALPQRPGEKVDTIFQESGLTVELNSAHPHTLPPANHLLHLCVGRLRERHEAPVAWILDAMLLLREADVGWEKLVAMAKECEVSQQLGAALDYLSKTLGAPVPPAVLQELNNTPVSNVERLERASTGGGPEPARRTMGQFQRYKIAAKATTSRHKAVSLPRFLQHTWGLDSLWQVPGYARSAMKRQRKFD